MTQGIELLEIIYGQLHEAGIIRSKGEFSERLLGKSPSYLTSMRAKQRVISSEVIMGLGDNLIAEIAELGSDPAHVETCAVLRRAVAEVNNNLADRTIPAKIALQGRPAGEKPIGRSTSVMNWFRVLVGTSLP
jgi:hypothetical protein